jgi:hypothetical protein
MQYVGKNGVCTPQQAPKHKQNPKHNPKNKPPCDSPKTATPTQKEKPQTEYNVQASLHFPLN